MGPKVPMIRVWAVEEPAKADGADPAGPPAGYHTWAEAVKTATNSAANKKPARPNLRGCVVRPGWRAGETGLLGWRF